MTATAVRPPPSPVSLTYAPLDHRRRRRWLWQWAVGLITAGLLAGMTWQYPWWYLRACFYQQRCMNYTAPPTRVVYEEDPIEATKLLAQPGYVRADYQDPWSEPNQGPSTIVSDPTAVALQARSCVMDYWQIVSDEYHAGQDRRAVIFSHRLRSAAGERLVIVSATSSRTLYATTYEPVRFSLTPTIVRYGSRRTAAGCDQLRLFAGQMDVTSPARFTIRYEAEWTGPNGSEAGAGTIVGLLTDEGGVTLTVADGPLHRWRE